ncbi:pyridoxamine 5'-phosphate oxidase family protein [Caldimonas sp.]|uniref:pyridoxamine 5'-phosphate oxidase family protein n=1 Tax=Caldimonas sp. TaxID=2838790 RepID=UPI00391D5AD8
MTRTERPATLAAVEAAVWQELARAAQDRQHAWRTPVLATGLADGADARVVVLREVDVQARTLVFYTDIRSGKVAQLLEHPRATVVMWSPTLGWQLRCRVQLSLDTQGVSVLSRWARLKLSPAAQDYLSPLPPGHTIDAPVRPTLPRDDRGHFGVLFARIDSIDWLELHREGHRRARFDAEGARWLQP